MEFNLSITSRRKGVYVVRPEGQLDTESTPYFEKKVKPALAGSTGAFLLDLAGLEYLSSVGIGAIFDARKAIEAKGAIFLVSGPRPEIRKILLILKVVPEEKIFADLDACDGHLAEMMKKGGPARRR